MIAMSMTPRQAAALRYIHGYQLAHGYCPRFEDIRDALGLYSKANVGRLLDQLAERGWVRRMPGRARSIEVLRPLPVPHAPDGAPLYAVPLIGVRTVCYSEARI